MQQGLLQQQPCSKQKTSVLSFLLIGLLISFFVSSDVMGSSGGGGTNATAAATTGATILCVPPVCTISGGPTICPGTGTMLCAPVGLASYLWSTGATTQCITVTTPGTYLVTVGSSGGCTSTCNITLGTVTCSITGNTSICPGGTTQLCAIAGATSYAWSNGATTRCISVSTGGTYSVTVCINGCYLTCSVTVTVNTLNCSISGNNTICSGGSTQLCAPSGAASYSWSTGATTRCITVNSAGTYTVTISNGSCSSTCSKTITSNPPLNCTISGNTSICPGGSTTLCLPSGYASYSWNTGATTRCITVSAAGTYYGNVNDGTCNRTCNTTVTVSSPNCSITGSSSICPGASTQLCAPAGMSSYSWSTGATTQCINVNSAGTYSVTISNGACTTSCSKTVTVSNPSCTITGSSTVCNGNSTQLCAPAGMSTYAWSTGATTQCITVSNSGTYSVTTSNGSCTSSCSKTVTISPPLNCAITGNTTICSGGSTSLCLPIGYASYSWNTGATTRCITVSAAGTYYGNVNNGTCNTTCNVTVTVSNISCSITGSSTICPGGSTQLCAPSGMATYLWSTGATSQCININSPGTYTVTVTNAGCTNTCSKTITQSNPSCSITGNLNICQGGSTQLCAPQGMSGYSWSTGATTQCISVNAPGTYTVTVSNGNCSSTCSQTVTQTNPQPCQITGNLNICQGGSTQLCASTAISYLWSTGATTQCITVNSAGTYSVTTFDGSCSTNCSATVTVGNNLNCTITGNTNLCVGGSTTLCAPAGMVSYLWNTGATTQCINVNSQGTYTVTISNGSCTNSCSATVLFNNTLVCSITGNLTICPGGTTQLCAPPGLTYAWNTGATSQCINVGAGTYTVTITNGTCTSTCSATVTTSTALPCSISGNLVICPGGSTVLCAPVGMTSYAWSTGATTQCITVNTPGTYAVTISNNGCTNSCNATVTAGSLNCSITGGTIPCGSGVTQICAPAGMVSYMWSTGATTQCITVQAGTYSVTISNGACISSCSTTVTSTNPPNCNITGDNTVCSGASNQLCATGGMASYLWSTGATTQCITVNSPSTYSVTITDANGCSSSCNKTVTLNPPPTCAITGNTNICGGGSTSLCATAGMSSYLWSTGSTQQCITVNVAGNYTVTITNSSGCTSSCSQLVSSTNCGISLTKNASTCEVGQGTVTPVLFTYVVTNNSSSNTASGNIIDDNGTPNNLNDDVNVCNWGPIAPGGSATCTHTFNISSNYTNTAVANGTSGGSSVTATASASVSAISCLCNIQYPDNSNLPRSAVVFNESEVLVASDPGPMSCGTTGSVIKLWYSDEHAMTLGVRQVDVKTAAGTTSTTYPITTGTTPACVTNPLVGSTIASGNQAGNDEAAGGGRPLWPALFITDLTVNGANSRVGDWQQGGTGITPSRVCGVWKGALKVVDMTHNPAVVTITPDADPAKNHWNIAGGDVPPGGFGLYQDKGYGAEVSWDVNSLGLLPGHTYRLQFMVHDGDQNKSGGDVGETCTTIHIPATNCASLVNVGNLVWSDANSNGLKDVNEIGIPGLAVKLYADVNNDNLPDGSSIATTNTDGNGIYNFGFLNPGNYIVGVVLPTGATVVPINGGDPDNNLDNDNNALNLVGNEVRSNTVTLNTSTEPTNDGDGNNGNLSVDFAIHSTTNILQKCYVGVSHHYVTATQSWTINTTTNTATIRTTFSKNFVDNTYGANAISWPNGHTFSNLTGSDKLTLQLYDVNHVKRMEFAIDYISASNTFPSGYGSLGVTGGDGSMTLGSANDVLNVETSIDKNFNDFGYILNSVSPATTATYTPNPTYPNWIYDVWYEVTVNLSAFPGGFGEPLVSGIHASPSKTGSNTEIMTDTTCVFTPRLAAPTAAALQYNENNLFVNAYPNPFTGSTTIEFQRSDKSSHIKIEVFTLAGKKVIDLFNQIAEEGITYKTEFNAENLSDGIYIYKLETEDRVINGKLILMR